jgi:hypothetical protein
MGLLLLFAATASEASANPDFKRASFEWTLGGPYDGEGPFVAAPAEASGMMTMVFSVWPVGVACFPADVAYSTARWNWESFGGLWERCTMQGALAAGWGAYMVSGAPFFVLKKVFWDVPAWMLGIHGAPEDRGSRVTARVDTPNPTLRS